MDTTDFLARLPALWDSDPQTADHPRDRRFGPVLEATRGMATENKLALLNLAAQHLGPDEIYLEVGAWAGCSIIGASLGHPDRTFVTTDNFSEFGGPIDECRANLASFGAEQVELVDGDFMSVLAKKALPGPVGVYFYDGAHAFEDQIHALEIIEPLLADEALVIVDDTSHPRVAAANRLYVGRRPQFELAVRYTSAFNGEPKWWDGVELYVFRRALGPGQPPPLWPALVARTRWGVAAVVERSTLLAKRMVRKVIPASTARG